MNRELKFRVWDIVNKEFNFPGDRQFLIGLDGKLFDGNGCPYDEHHIVQQYTGFTDANGKEIYEGDILTCDLVGGDDPQTVIFKDGIFTLDYLTPGCYTLHDELSQMVGHKVIGNIFENSQLIK